MYIKNGLDKLTEFMIEFIVDINYRKQYGGVFEMKTLHNKYKSLCNVFIYYMYVSIDLIIL
jgi:hypothetical protein